MDRMSVIARWTPEDYERMADAILRGDAVRLGASARDVQDAAEIALDRVRQQLQGAVETLIDARAALHRACLALGSTDGYNETFARINAAITAAGGR